MDRKLGFYNDFSMRKNIFYHYGNGSSSNELPVLDMVNPYLSKYSSHLQPRSHGTCDSIDWHVGTFFCVNRALDMSCFESTNQRYSWALVHGREALPCILRLKCAHNAGLIPDLCRGKRQNLYYSKISQVQCGDEGENSRYTTQ